ncbi:MAG: hypothetical protein L0338_39730 [Acidobacteria bacterium]|nr:hypothetical protein [Acidobacteriota bacterium]
MRIRAYQESDKNELMRLYQAQGLDYLYPNFEHPEFFTRLVLEDEKGEVVMAIMGRLTAEMFLLMDPRANGPGVRLKHFLTLHRASEHDMALKGIGDCYAQIPPGMEKFKRLLSLLGWVRADTWQPWTKPELKLYPQLPPIFERKFLGGDHGTQGASTSQGDESKPLQLATRSL